VPRRGYRSSSARGSDKKGKPRKPYLRNVGTRGFVRQGGARAGAGRKPGPQAGRVPWREIERAAAAGAPYDEIVGGIDIAPEDLQDRATQERIRGSVERGNLKFKLRLRRAIKKRGIEQGSVNSLALMARNALDWDQQLAQQGQQPPDMAGVGVRLVELIEKLAKGGKVAEKEEKNNGGSGVDQDHEGAARGGPTRAT